MFVPLFIFLLLLFLVIKLKKSSDAASAKFNHIPGPSPLPFFGHGLHLFYHAMRGDLYEWQQSLSEHYGHVCRFLFSPNEMNVLVSDLDDIKMLLTSPKFEKRAYSMVVLAPIFGKGIFGTFSDWNWKVQRNTASIITQANAQRSYVPTFVEYAQLIVSTLQEHVESGTPVNIQDVFRNYTLDAIAYVGFGISLNCLKGNKEGIHFSNAFDRLQELSVFRFYIDPIWKYLPEKELKACEAAVDKFSAIVVANREEEIAAGKDFSSQPDLLSSFMAAKGDDGKSLFEGRYLRDIIKNFLVAGRDTTSVCLTWTIYLLSIHPHVVDKMEEEIRRVIGTDPLTYENLSQLKYMRQVIDESLRLFPPVPSEGRVALEDIVLPSGYHIPAGSTISYNAFTLHKLSAYWKDPMRFNPDRWETDVIKAFQFVPFHGGPHICLGQSLAYLEVKVALCAIIPKFDFKLKNPELPRYALTLTMPVKDGLHVYVSARKS